jgi:hypothetical protein
MAGFGVATEVTGAVRCELFAGEALDKQRAVVHIKSNIGPIGPAQGYEITSSDETGRLWQAGYFRWTGGSHLGVAELTEPEATDDEGRTNEAEEFLQEALKDGPRLAREIIKEAREIGIAERTLKRAKEKLSFKARKRLGDGRWEWALQRQECQYTEIGTLEPPQHTISNNNNNNLDKSAKSAKDAFLGEVGTLVGGDVNAAQNPSKPVKTLPSCPKCGSFALYRDGSCMTCEGV